MPEHGLSPHQLHIIQDILAPYAPVITRVGLFGSRALGTARPNSDIDLVLYGPVFEAVVDHLHTLFDESGLERDEFRSNRNTHNVTPDLFRGPGATRKGLSLEPWTPE